MEATYGSSRINKPSRCQDASGETPAEDLKDRESRLTLQADPVDQVGGRIADASCAATHAETLNVWGRSEFPAQESLLRLQRNYGNRYVGDVLRLAAKKAPDAAQSVGAEGGWATFLPGTTGDENSTLYAGEKGFTVQMLKFIPVQAGKTFGYYKDAHLKTVIPNLAPIDKKLREATTKQQEAKDKLDTTLPTIPSYYRIWGERLQYWETRAQGLAANRAKEPMLCEDFNAGVPRANQVFLSLAKLEALQEVLGVNSPAAMSRAVVSSLKEAEAIAEKVQVKGSAGDLDVPAADAQVTSATKELTIAQKKMSTAWIGVQRTLVLKRAAEVSAEGEDERKRLKEITDTITTIKRIGATIDVSMAVMGVGLTGATEGGGLIGAIEGKARSPSRRTPLLARSPRRAAVSRKASPKRRRRPRRHRESPSRRAPATSSRPPPRFTTRASSSRFARRSRSSRTRSPRTSKWPRISALPRR